jgi:RNA polymerase primary sigma factor
MAMQLVAEQRRSPLPKKRAYFPVKHQQKEAVIESTTVDTAEEHKPFSEPSDSFLSLYFREMAPIEVLKPEEEFKAAQHIESIEVSLWSQLLSYQPLTDLVWKVIKEGMPNGTAELMMVNRSVRRLKQFSGPANHPKLLEKREALARKLHLLDVDRRFLTSLVAELDGIMRNGRSKILNTKLGPTQKSQVFKTHHRRTMNLWLASQRARNTFIQSNLRLVVSIARRFNHGRMPLSDLIQEGNIGLIKAVERFDYRRGYRFSTYASWWIRHSITRAIADKGRAVRLPVHMLDAHQKVARTSRELSSKLGRLPTAEEIGFSSGLGYDKVEKIQGFQLDQSLSLDRAVSDEDDRRFVEMLFDPEGLVPAEKLMNQSVSEQVQQILSDLKPIEADVLCKRFGLEGTQEQTLKEIGDGYRLSRERIRQIQEQALGKIRRALQRRDAI